MLWSRSRPDTGPPPRLTTDGDDSDDRLVAAAQADPRAFAALYERYLERVYRYCYLRLGDREAAEDATSEAFLKALASLGAFHGGVFAAWLFRIAHNVVVDRHRRRRATASLEVAASVPDPARTPEEHALAGDERERLRAALAALPEEQRMVLELQLAGWTGEETARLMGKSLGAVKTQRFRAVARLRELLQNDTSPHAMEAHDA
ncbi:MAG TPA: sigma-70 family RNA polymerase sigma factor [Chloroflexota bacterium]